MRGFQPKKEFSILIAVAASIHASAAAQDVIDFEDNFDDSIDVVDDHFEIDEYAGSEDGCPSADASDTGTSDADCVSLFAAGLPGGTPDGRAESLTLSAGFTSSYESNAQKIPDGPADYAFTPSLGAVWISKGKQDRFIIGGSVAGTDYQDDVAGDYSYITAKGAYVRSLSKQDSISLSVSGLTFYGDLFDDWKFSRMRLEGGLTHIFAENPKAKDKIIPKLSLKVRHDFLNPSELSNNYAAISLPHKIKYSSGWAVSLTPAASYKRYGDLFGVVREDLAFEAALTVERDIIKDKLSISATAKVSTRDSTDPLKDYTGFEAPLSIKLSRAFSGPK